MDNVLTVNYSSPEFESKFTYTGNDLGVCLQGGKTTFRVWAPVAQEVILNLYRSGDPDAQDLLQRIPMTSDICGTWLAEIFENLHGLYYTYTVTNDHITRETIDPYACSCGVNGKRGMVLDLPSTDPQGWEQDIIPHKDASPTDAIIYELHFRDLSCDRHSGIHAKGKFLGLTETGTKTARSIPTGLDHIKNLGVTHIHPLPSYDYGSVDEAHPEWKQYNWGYDPMNFNIPEGSYATDPYHGEVRVREMKQMIKTLHENGLGVILDVVYNHVYDAGSFCFNCLVPGYFNRINADGTYSNGSCCGNDTASERSMVRKYIVDSVCYWADEYHMDGFRFDLVGLLDVKTIQEIVAEVHKSHPHVLFYGEGWNMDTKVTKPNTALATQSSAALLPGFGFFSDQMRDVLKGSVFTTHGRGYVSGESGLTDTIKASFRAVHPWTDDPTQVVNYTSCHDNMTLFDKLVASTRGASRADQIAMNTLAASIYLLSQGIPLFQAGEEMLRSKKRRNGSFEHNSYCSPDSVNAIKWNNLKKPEYQRVLAYYQGLIRFRKAHKVLRLTSGEEIARRIRTITGIGDEVAAFYLRGDDGKDLFIAFNPLKRAVTMPLPEGRWDVCIHGDKAGTESLGHVSGAMEIPAISALALVLSTN